MGHLTTIVGSIFPQLWVTTFCDEKCDKVMKMTFIANPSTTAAFLELKATEPCLDVSVGHDSESRSDQLNCYKEKFCTTCRLRRSRRSREIEIWSACTRHSCQIVRTEEFRPLCFSASFLWASDALKFRSEVDQPNLQVRYLK
jgi:hypothetical protein